MSTTTWPKDFFNRRYLDMFMARSPEKLEFETDVIARYAQLKCGTSVMDFCCGTGDLLHTMHERFGIKGEGVELVDDYVNIASSRPGIKVWSGSALDLSLRKRFDVALNWFSSFGYFDHKDNWRLLDNMWRHVRPGGVLLMEGYNSTYILNHFNAVMAYERKWEGRTYQITRSSELSKNRRQMHQTWKFECEEGVDSFDTHIELYRPEELRELVDRAGFEKIQILTTPLMERPVFDEPATDESPRILVIGTKS
jgi:SAM-dependent methyltransferase